MTHFSSLLTHFDSFLAQFSEFRLICTPRIARSAKFTPLSEKTRNAQSKNSVFFIDPPVDFGVRPFIAAFLWPRSSFPFAPTPPTPARKMATQRAQRKRRSAGTKMQTIPKPGQARRATPVRRALALAWRERRSELSMNEKPCPDATRCSSPKLFPITARYGNYLLARVGRQWQENECLFAFHFPVGHFPVIKASGSGSKAHANRNPGFHNTI